MLQTLKEIPLSLFVASSPSLEQNLVPMPSLKFLNYFFTKHNNSHCYTVDWALHLSQNPPFTATHLFKSPNPSTSSWVTCPTAPMLKGLSLSCCFLKLWIESASCFPSQIHNLSFFPSALEHVWCWSWQVCLCPSSSYLEARAEMAFGVEGIYLWKKKGGSRTGQREKSNWYSGLTKSWPTHLGALEGTLLLELCYLEPRRSVLCMFS